MSATLINIALDLETLSTQENAAIIQIGCCIPEFDRQFLMPDISPEFEVTIRYEDCLSSEFHKDPETMKWWEKQNPKTRNNVFSGQDTYVDAMEQLKFWLESVKILGAQIAIWGNGSDFDNRLLSYTADSLGYHNLWDFRNNRDLRTLKALFPLKIEAAAGEIKHTALGDARYEARLIHAIRTTYNLETL
jgi:exodeoxyribonuclease VIII